MDEKELRQKVRQMANLWVLYNRKEITDREFARQVYSIFKSECMHSWRTQDDWLPLVHRIRKELVV
jgi:hypothetical protein